MKNFNFKMGSIILIPLHLSLFSQVGVGTPTPRGALDINTPTTNNKGLVLPTNDDPKNMINPMGGSIAVGTVMYDSTLKCIRFYKPSGWSNCLSDQQPAFQLKCDGALTGSFKANVNSNGSKIINYTGGQGQSYEAIDIASTGVTGLNAKAAAGTLTNDEGSITLTITGTPNSSGIAYFTVNIGESTCTFQIQVDPEDNNFALQCGRAQFFGTTSIGASSTGQLRIPYNNGDGSVYNGGQQFSSSQVTGLIAESNRAVLDNNAPLDFTIKGTASNQGYAIFNITVLNSKCTVSIPVPTSNL